jgi:hypothetical protein
MKHRGMTKKQREAWHKRHPGPHPRISPKAHAAFMKKMGISPEEDRKWHEVQDTAAQRKPASPKDTWPINPFAVGGGFL